MKKILNLKVKLQGQTKILTYFKCYKYKQKYVKEE